MYFVYDIISVSFIFIVNNLYFPFSQWMPWWSQDHQRQPASQRSWSSSRTSGTPACCTASRSVSSFRRLVRSYLMPSTNMMQRAVSLLGSPKRSLPLVKVWCGRDWFHFQFNSKMVFIIAQTWFIQVQFYIKDSHGWNIHVYMLGTIDNTFKDISQQLAI